METEHKLSEFAPAWEADNYSGLERERLSPFFTNLDKSVYAPLISSPEVVGALCSRTSRAAGDLRAIFIKEYINPFLQPERNENESDEEWQNKVKYGQELQEFIYFLRDHPVEQIYSNPRARSFYAKWLAQYGDDSIAQMAGAHLVYSSLSQLAIKHFEDQRIGLAPIEKSTRYVDYSQKIAGQYRYYTDPQLADWGWEEEYRAAMDNLFKTYTNLKLRLAEDLQKRFPAETPGVVEKKAFDTLRGLLPVATLSQLALFGNGQAFEYMIARSAKHRLGEVRWAADAAYGELNKVVPAFLRRLRDPDSIEVAQKYQEYMAGRGERVGTVGVGAAGGSESLVAAREPTVKLVEHDKEGENKVVVGMLYTAAGNRQTWTELMEQVRIMSEASRRDIVEKYLAGRSQRWQKVGRAFEHTYVRFEIEMDIGSWRDLHRHRMLTQQRQLFSFQHGYLLPNEVVTAGLADQYEAAIEQAAAIYDKLATRDEVLAQYAVPMACNVRFVQWKNLRECFWEMELRTIPEGHPTYREIEQEKFKLLEQVYPMVCSYMQVNMGNYDFARRGQEGKIQEKLRQLEKMKT